MLATVLLVSIATAATAALVFLLSLRLRRREIDTIYKIGGSRPRVLGILSSEILVVVTLAGGLALVIAALTRYYGAEVIQRLLLS